MKQGEVQNVVRLNHEAVRLNHVSVHGNGTLLLQNISLDIQRGEIVAVIGANGSGKSTLAKVIAGLFPTTWGEVERYIEPVGVILQNPELQIVGETVFEDLCFGMENMAVDPDVMPERAYLALQELGLSDKLHVPVAHLSGGQKQLLNMAGCLAAQAELLVCDEVTSMLDMNSRKLVLHTVQKLRQRGKTIVWITHFMEELYLADRIVILDGGKMAFCGSRFDFFYSGHPSPSVCERMGFQLPYAVRFSRKWMELGGNLGCFPVSAAELKEALGSGGERK